MAERRKMSEFLVHLAEHQELWDAWAEDPDRVMREFGLDQEQRAALRDPNPHRVAAAIRRAEGKQAEVYLWIKAR